LARASNNFKVKRSEVFWNLHQKDVLQEISILLGVEEVTTITPGWFPLRLPAICNIIKRMSPEELGQLDADVERTNKEGYPDEVKKKYVSKMAKCRTRCRLTFIIHYRLAEKYSSKRIEDNARCHWKEMGVMSVTFTAYTAPDGKLVIDA
jgi:hypothetical protein